MKSSEQKQLGVLGQSTTKHAGPGLAHRVPCSRHQARGWLVPPVSPASQRSQPAPAVPLKAKLSSEGLSHHFPPQSLPLSETTQLKILGASQGSTTNENKLVPRKRHRLFSVSGGPIWLLFSERIKDPTNLFLRCQQQG